MARRWCNIPKTVFMHLCEAPDFDKGQDRRLPRDSVFIPMCNKRYISKPKNKEIGSVFRKDWFPHVVFCSPFFGLNSHLECGCPPSLLIRPGFQDHARRSPRRGTFRYSSGTGGPTYVDGANSLSWNFIGIPRKPSYSASFSLLLFSGWIPIWCMGTHQAC